MTTQDEAVVLSIVVPIHDERENLRPLLRELNEVLETESGGIEVLLVDDGSGDGSTELIASLARDHA